MPFLVDTFTDTNSTLLENHTPNTGGAWQILGFAVGAGTPGVDTVILSNALRTAGTTNASGAHHRNAADPGADEYDIELTMNFSSTVQANRILAVSWRMSSTGTTNAAVDRYTLLGFNTGTPQQWQIRKYVGGTETTLATENASLAGTSKTVRIEVRSGGATVFVDNVSTISTTDTAITQRGRVGVCVSRAVATDISIDDLSAVAAVDSVDIDAAVTATAGITAEAELTEGLFVFAHITADAELITDTLVDADVTATAGITADAAVVRAASATVTATAGITADATVVGMPQVDADVEATATLTATTALDQPATAAVTASATLTASAATDQSAVAAVTATAGITASAVLGEPPPLFDLQFIPLAPELGHGPALAPEMTERIALAPELGHGAAGEPETVARVAGEPELGHGAGGSPETAHGQPEVELGHGNPGEPEI